MKIRSGYVSNSSSSSFICDICHRDYTGMDATIQEASMVHCVNGHTICTEHLLYDIDIEDFTVEMIKKIVGRIYQDKLSKYSDQQVLSQVDEQLFNEIVEDDVGEFYYNFPSSCCPLCNFSKLTDEEELLYLRKKYNTNKQQSLEEIKQKYSTFEEFKKDVNNR